MSDDFVFVEDDPTPLPGTFDSEELKEKKRKREMLEEARDKAVAELERESLLMDELAPEYKEKLAVLTDRFYREKIDWWKGREEEARQARESSEFPFDEEKGYLVSKPSPEQEMEVMARRGMPE
jgi:hypothetical protein